MKILKMLKYLNYFLIAGLLCLGVTYTVYIGLNFNKMIWEYETEESNFIGETYSLESYKNSYEIEEEDPYVKIKSLKINDTLSVRCESDDYHHISCFKNDDEENKKTFNLFNTSFDLFKLNHDVFIIESDEKIDFVRLNDLEIINSLTGKSFVLDTYFYNNQFYILYGNRIIESYDLAGNKTNEHNIQEHTFESKIYTFNNEYFNVIYTESEEHIINNNTFHTTQLFMKSINLNTSEMKVSEVTKFGFARYIIDCELSELLVDENNELILSFNVESYVYSKAAVILLKLNQSAELKGTKVYEIVYNENDPFLHELDLNIDDVSLDGDDIKLKGSYETSDEINQFVVETKNQNWKDNFVEMNFGAIPLTKKLETYLEIMVILVLISVIGYTFFSVFDEEFTVKIKITELLPIIFLLIGYLNYFFIERNILYFIIPFVYLINLIIILIRHNNVIIRFMLQLFLGLIIYYFIFNHYTVYVKLSMFDFVRYSMSLICILVIISITFFDLKKLKKSDLKERG